MSITCELGTCKNDATHYLVVVMQKAAGARQPEKRKRMAVCRDDLALAMRLQEAGMTKVHEYGRLDNEWTVYKGGKYGV